jgi:hypothetical protein
VNYDYEKVKNWLKSKDHYLPGISDLSTATRGEVVIIGAAVFELYERQGWITKLLRTTGDIDLSVGLINDDLAYSKAKGFLINRNYSQDPTHPYRFHPERKIVGGYAYIDLLAHPQNSDTAAIIAQNAMGVGPGFALENFQYAKINAYDLKNGMVFPNPFGFISLKIASYLNDPLKRIKDFADIVELINGIVETGTHFEIESLWKSMKDKSESRALKKAIGKMKNPDEVGDWDLDAITDELLKRTFQRNFIESTLRNRISDFNDQLTD